MGQASAVAEFLGRHDVGRLISDEDQGRKSRTMLERFTGRDGQRFVTDALRNQSIVGEGANLTEIICDSAEVLAFAPGAAIIEESAPDNDIYFILAGVVSICVGGREIAVRTAGQHIGEMAVVDPGQSRSASAVAEDEVVVARVPAGVFIDLAEANPRLWRNIARGLAERLRQRNLSVLSVNPRPVLFVGCSTEALPVARAIESTIAHDPIVVRVWSDDIFEASSFPIESLERQLPGVDFAALVLSPDDRVVSRDTASDAPRDNVLFELGLFMGALGHSRTFLVYPHGIDIKIPTDLVGLTVLTYRSGPRCELLSAIAPACHQLKKQVLAAGPR